MPDPNKVVQALRAALAKMNDTGAHWTKRSMYDQNQQGEDMFCSLGAILAVTGVDVAKYEQIVDDGEDPTFLFEDGDIETRKAVVEALALSVPKPITSLRDANTLYNVITYWNDAQAESWDDVQKTFAKAEKIAVEGVPAKEEA